MNDLQIVEYNGIRVLTTQQIAEAYGTDRKAISKNFSRNKDRYVEGKHYIPLTGEEKQSFLDRHQFDDGLKNAGVIYLWTQKGAFLHAKSLNTDKAWEVYDRLIDSYFEKPKPKTIPEQIQIIAKGYVELEKKVNTVEQKVVNLENNMTLDYGQQRVLEDTVNKTVIDVLGGKASNAYVQIGKKVFAECNRDLKHYFNVNARNNVPKKRFDEAVEYAKNWKPCTNTMMMISDCNAQIRLVV